MIEISRIDRELHARPGAGHPSRLNPAINLHRCVEFSGSFTITTALSLVSGNDSYMYFYASPPMIQDEWRIDPNSIFIEFIGGTVWWNTYNNIGVNAYGSVATAYGLTPTIVLTKTGATTALTVNGVTIFTTTAVTYPDSRVYIGVREESPAKIMKINTISTSATAVSTIPVAHQRVPDSIRGRAEANYPFLKMGCAVSAVQLALDPTYQAILAREFNEVSIENALKFQYVQPRQGYYDFYEADLIVAFAQKNGMQLHGHTFAWSEGTPGWVWDGGFSKAALTTILQTHIATVIGRYKGQFRTWDIINEPFVEFTSTIRPSIWMNTIGRDYIKIALRAAAAADPNLKLFINEWGCENPGTKQNALYALVQELQGEGVPIHGVGLQMHEDMNADYQLPLGNNKTSTEPSTLKTAIQRFQGLGIEVRVSEVDVNLHATRPGYDDARAAYYAGWLNACIETGVKSFCMWGFTDKWSSLQGWFDYRAYANGHIYSETYEPRAAYAALKNRLST